MKKTFPALLRFLPVFLCLWLVAVASSGPAMASSGHYLNGSLGLKAASLPPPGHYFGFLSMHYTADRVNNANGNKIPVNYSLDMTMFAPHYVYSSEYTILGARYAFDLLIPFVHTNFSVSKNFNIPLPFHRGIAHITAEKTSTSTGLSDIALTPIMLTWEGSRYDITAGMTFFIPTGEFSSKDITSPGKGFWSFVPSLGATVYFDEAKTWHASANLHYEIHTEQEETNRTFGNHAHLEWGVGKTFLQIFKAGVVGYSSWQATHDSGPRTRETLSEAHGIGPEIGVYLPWINLDLTLRYLQEFENRNTSQGSTTTLSIMYTF